LEANLPSSHGSLPPQWGAFQWLWASQDHRELPTDKLGDPTISLHLETKDSGTLLVTPKFQTVQNSVQTFYANYFTKTGRTGTNSPIPDIEKEIEKLQQKSAELKAKIKEVDDKKQQLESLQRQLPFLEKKIEETKEELNRARGEALDFSSIESDLKAAEAGVREAERDVQDAKKALNKLKESADKIELLQKKEKEARENFYRIEALCDQFGSRLQEKREEVEEKAMKIRESEELTKDARILYTKFDITNKIKEVENKIKKIESIDKEIEGLRTKEALNAPTNKEIEKLTQSQIRIETLKASLTSRGLVVNITPGEKGSLAVEVDGERIKDDKLTATGTESVSAEAPGFGKVTVQAKLEQAHDAKVDILHLEESIQEALDKYTVSSIDELKDLNMSQNEILNKIKELAAERRGIDERLTDEITLELKKLNEKFEEIKKIKRTPNAIELNPIDVDFGKLVNKREKEEDETRKALDKARIERDKIDEELNERKEELAGIRAEQKRFSEDLDDARTQEREIIRQYGSVENQGKILGNAQKELQKQNEKYEEIKHRYEELEKGPINKIKRLEQQLENQEQLIRQQRTSIDQIKGGITTASLEGVYSKLAESESHTEILSERLEKEQIHAESYKLLKEALEQQYRSALSVVVGPIQEEVKRSLSYVTGFLHEEVELNEFLFPLRLGERGVEEISLEFDDGSSGLKEALSLCVRLAVAKHLSERDSQCLVLDDPFVHVSLDRSNKMIELINEVIREHDLQVVVFTHRPMEFAGFSGKMIDIQSVKK